MALLSVVLWMCFGETSADDPTLHSSCSRRNKLILNEDHINRQLRSLQVHRGDLKIDELLDLLKLREELLNARKEPYCNHFFPSFASDRLKTVHTCQNVGRARDSGWKKETAESAQPSRASAHFSPFQPTTHARHARRNLVLRSGVSFRQCFQ